MSEINKNISLLRKNNFTGFTENSNFVEKDFVFLSFEQDKKIASKHASEAKKNGAKIIISKVSIEKDSKILNLIDKNLSANKEIYLKYLFNRNLEDLSIVGITGTNGKSSTAFFLHQFLLNSGFNPTLLTNIPEIPIKNCEVSPLTTPGNFLLHYYLKKSIDLKRDFFLMEVSSHSINQERIKGLNFKSKSLTSFSKDHLDYHKSIDNYRNTKESFFDKGDENIVISIDNDLGKKIAKKNNSALKVSLNNKKADIYLNKGSIHTPWGNIKSRLSIDSDFMLSNLLCALGIYGKINNNLEINLTDNKIFTLPGRLELIKVFEDKYCYIDYAHTPEALGSILRYLKSKYSGQVVCLFGCGGDRDISKRNEMGVISETNSDLQIITNDNPRNEDPLNIARSITKKMRTKNYEIILDRKEAITSGLIKLKDSPKNSVLLIAGKGHENSLILKNQKIPFNDSAIVNELKNVI